MKKTIEKKKIALVTVTLSDGGAERVAADLSIYFDAMGYEVHHIVFSGKIEYNHKGIVHHLVNDTKNKLFNKIIRFINLRKIVKKQQFDYVLDFRNKENSIQEIIVNNFIYPKFIQTVHNYHLDYYFFKNKFLTKLLYLKCKHFVCVSEKIKNKVIDDFGYKNVSVIYNPIQFRENNPVNLNFNFNFIVAAGRLHINNVKQFDVIIKNYAKSKLPGNNVKLIILGTGELLYKLEKLVKELNLEVNVIFTGFVNNPFDYYKNAKFLVMASKYEGFPMVMIECLAMGTPVVSWDFNSGPNEIISHRENGLLIENRNEQALIDAMNEMIYDNNLYLHCKNNAQASVQRFELNVIGKQWENFLNQK